uniref:Uncharacterized protein n=1 Tax=Ananas comosus var. bracteatus TaxID=296719 RepID=A0A6V7PQK7_ANACO|nr:unnamed protein product [Ananas comosus var. bracteatus]
MQKHPCSSPRSDSATAYRYTGPHTGTHLTKLPNPSLGLAEKLPVYRYTSPYRYSHQPCTGTQPAEGYPRADQKSDFSGFGAKLQTSILGVQTIGWNTVNDPPEQLNKKLGSQIKHSNPAICKSPVCYILPS